MIRLFTSSGRLLGLRRRSTIERLVLKGNARWLGAERARLLSSAEESDSFPLPSKVAWYKRNAIPGVVSVAHMTYRTVILGEEDA